MCELFASRPVMALFEVQLMEVKDKEKDRVFEEVLSQQGPQDATVIIAVDGGEFEDDIVDEIVGTFSNTGEIILVRLVLICFFEHCKQTLVCLVCPPTFGSTTTHFGKHNNLSHFKIYNIGINCFSKNNK